MKYIHKSFTVRAQEVSEYAESMDHKEFTPYNSSPA